MSDHTYTVVTEIPPHEKGGNMATALGQIYTTHDEHRSYQRLDMAYTMNMAIPVFTLAEILILDNEYGREVAGKGRKPSKWDVEIEHFQDLERAIVCAEEVIVTATNKATATHEETADL